MAVQIKFFLKVRKLFEAAGYSSQNGFAFNRKNLFHLTSLGLLSISTFTFLLFQANSVYEYGASYTGFLVGLEMVFDFEWNATHLFDCADKCSKTISYTQFWQYSVHTRIIQEGKYLSHILIYLRKKQRSPSVKLILDELASWIVGFLVHDDTSSQQQQHVEK